MRRLGPFALILCLAAACRHAAAQAPAAAAPAPPAVLREFRGAWVATVDNIDWPSRKGLTTPQLLAELDALVERAAALHLNALVFQVRPCADAFYASKLEPWSEWLSGTQGQAPNPPFDPLQVLLERAHARGLQVHAWCNPFRARHSKSAGDSDPHHVLRALPGACVRYGDEWWLDPGDPRAADWTLRVLADIVERYDVDGLHLDDYFYPYPQKGLEFPDAATYAAYQQRGGKLARGDWRRANIDGFVQRLAQQAHKHRPYVLVGISPFGIARPGVPAGIQAGIDQYEQLGADVVKWLQGGLVDYLSPQLYWPIDQKAQSFAVLLPWWQAQNTRHVHVWPGLAAGRALAAKAPWRADELVQQIDLIRAQGNDPGAVLFSFQALRREDTRQLRMLQQRLWTQPTLVPASPWLPAAMPPAAQARVERRGEALQVRWQAEPKARWVAVQGLVGGRWRTLGVAFAASNQIAVDDAGATAVAVTFTAANGVAGPAAVLAAPPR